MKLKILTFNHHEAFLSLLSQSGFDFDLVEQKGSLDLHWNPSAPPRPANMSPVYFDKNLRKNLREGYYDVVICHTIKNLIWMMPFRNNRFIFVAHIHLFRKSYRDKIKAWLKKLIYHLFSFTHNCQLIAVTHSKLLSWDTAGQVIVNVPGCRTAPEPSGADQQTEMKEPQVHPVIFVSNDMQRRGDEAGYQVIRFLAKQLALTVIGHNPGFPGAIIPGNYSQFCSAFRQGKIYVFPVRPPFDEFNLAMLEAMSMGMPVVCFEHPHSPVIHDVNGLIAHSTEEMLRHLKFLLNHPQECIRLGKAARQTIETQFSQAEFVRKWVAACQVRAQSIS
ncbi:MAG: glycosyltransferase family 4 protein [Deltaproteobacteria bacterium]|nr:glycosyltransferase family 4 protein [Deltaproteobacteria bacterium]